MPQPRRTFNFPWRSRSSIARDVDDELRFHLDMRMEELRRRGFSTDAARREALRQFGDIEDARRYIRDVDAQVQRRSRWSDLMDDLRQDIVYATRTLLRSPLFTLISVLTLALGIGANTAIFSVVNSILLRRLPYAEPERLVELQTTFESRDDAASLADFVDWRAGARSFEGMAALSGGTVNLTGTDAEPERLIGMEVTANFFSLLGLRPLAGRTFAPGEDAADAPRVAVINERIWRRLFGADPSVVGRTVSLNGTLHTIVGIIPQAAAYPEPYDVWTPLVLTPQNSVSNRGSRGEAVIARLGAGVTHAQAEAELQAIARRLAELYPNTNTNIGMRVVDLHESITGSLRTPLLVLLGAVAFVLLIACANVANLLLVRASRREGEMAVRSALGAGRGRLVRQLVTESVLLSLAGAASGLVLAHWGVRALAALVPGSLSALRSARIDGVVLGVTIALAVVTGIVFGLLPALQLRPSELAHSIRSGSRGVRTQRRASRLRDGIIIAEVALAVLLLCGAGLLIRSFQRLLEVDPGVRTEGLVTFNLALPQQEYEEPESQLGFARELEERLRRLPGAEGVGLVSFLPFASPGGIMALTFFVEGRPPLPAGVIEDAEVRVASRDYFRTAGIPVVRGRVFGAADRQGSPPVVVVNQEFVRRYFRDEDPIGKRIGLGWVVDGVRRGGEIVGVVGDVREFGPARPAFPFVYLSYAQVPYQRIGVAIQSRGDPAAVLAAAKGEVRAMDADLPIYNAGTMREAVGRTTAQPRFYAVLVGAFATVALLLAAVGLYGVISYVVSQRVHEIGVRIALGATGERVVRMVVGKGIALAAAGVALGLVASLGVTRVMSSLLHGVSATDPLTYAAVAVVLLGVATAASLLPARRAASVDPLVAMRAE